MQSFDSFSVKHLVEVVDAAAEALKKASKLLSVALEQCASNTAPASLKTVSGGNGGNGNSHQRSDQTGTGQGANGNGLRLTQRQLSTIWSLGRRLKMTADDIRDRSVLMFKQQPEHLSRSDASTLISEFSDELGGNPN